MAEMSQCNSREGSFNNKDASLLQCAPNISSWNTLYNRQKAALVKYPYPDHYLLPSKLARLRLVQANPSKYSSHPPEIRGFTRYLLMIQDFLFSAMSLIAWGHAEMHHVWTSIVLEADEDDDLSWPYALRSLYDRLQIVLITGGLLLASTATFLTTTPPEAHMANYTIRGPYICLLIAFGMLLGGTVVGSAQILFMAKIRAFFVRDVMLGDRFHVWGTLIILFYPFFTNCVATVLLAFGLLSSIWVADDPGLRGASILIVLLPFGIVLLLLAMWSTVKIKGGLASDAQELKETRTDGFTASNYV
ncbi:hypothetical protein DL96DRAFT_415007 [Flagelloscypha sp. PMI_526]|nr:hypothetical protein DL96DRAFT_415007 [Flagelloscypha sp. PMI_526]